VSPFSRAMNFHINGKLTSLNEDHYKTLEIIRKQSYMPELQESLTGIHPIMHVS
jgi:hypothetical protein